jgi:N-acetylmuramoyl-L-alanine amidase
MPGSQSTSRVASGVPRSTIWLVLLCACAFCVTATVATAGPTTPQRPHVFWRPIAFPSARKLEMQAYAKRHYGLSTWRLRNPRVIVEHITVSSTFASAFATFDADVADAELHELPGTCAHYVIDTDGTIYQLVPLSVMCRHTVGLNWTAIGIEHVGMTDAQVLANPRQMAASLALTTWLMSRYRVKLGDVIGHNESLTSRFHKERYAAWRCQTHGDWTRPDMTVYRRHLTAVARRAGVPLGGAVYRVTPNC